MSLFLGKPDFSAVNGFQEIQGDNANLNTTIQVIEGTVIKVNAGYALAMVVDTMTDLWKPDDFKSGTKVCFVAHTGDYTRWTKENPKLPCTPAPIEKAIIEWAEGEWGQKWVGNTFKGQIFLNGAESVLGAVRERKMWDVLFNLQEAEPNLLGEVKEGASGGSFKKGGGGQSELSKLNDRLEFLKTQLKGVLPDGCDTAYDIGVALTSAEKEMPGTLNSLEYILKLIMTNGK